MLKSSEKKENKFEKIKIKKEDIENYKKMVIFENKDFFIVNKKEEIAIISDTIERLLNDSDKKILCGVVFENKSFSQLAKEVGLSDKTVKKHYERIIDTLRKKL